jgi:hypothetical protein
MVIAAATFRGGRLVRADPPPVSRRPSDAALDAEQQLRLVLEGAADPRRFADLSERHGISEGQMHDWRAIAFAGAERALAEHGSDRAPT